MISVIMPTYNRAHLIKKAINSVLSQDYKDIELLVVDDASTDGTEELVKGIDDPRVTYIKLPERVGATRAWNTGIKKARGEFIAFLDSDDEWHKGKLSRQVEAFSSEPPGTGVIYTGTFRVADGKKSYIPGKRIRKKSGLLHGELLMRNFIPLPSAVVRRECFTELGMFDEELRAHTDWELWLRFSARYVFKFIDEPYVTAYFTEDSMTARNENFIVSLKIILERHEDDFKAHPEALANQYLRLGNRLCLAGRMKEGRGYFLRSLDKDPMKVASLVALVASLPGKNFYTGVFRFLKTA